MPKPPAADRPKLAGPSLSGVAQPPEFTLSGLDRLIQQAKKQPAERIGEAEGFKLLPLSDQDPVAGGVIETGYTGSPMQDWVALQEMNRDFVQRGLEPLKINQRPPFVHNASDNEWLLKNVQEAIARGVPAGVEGLDRPVPRGVVKTSNDREFLWNIQKQLESLGIQELDEFGKNNLPRVGAFKVAFGAGDKVVKLAEPDSSDYDMRLPKQVWGVTPPTAGWTQTPVRSEGILPMHDGLDVIVQPRVLLDHPKWGTADDKSIATLLKALEYQGWGWYDSHRGNMGYLPGEDFRPTVIDGDVIPAGWKQQTDFPFRPPTKPDWYYSVILPALMAGGEGEQQQQPAGPLGGLTRQ
jgi:hypothetical protein